MTSCHAHDSCKSHQWYYESHNLPPHLTCITGAFKFLRDNNNEDIPHPGLYMPRQQPEVQYRKCMALEIRWAYPLFLVSVCFSCFDWIFNLFSFRVAHLFRLLYICHFVNKFYLSPHPWREENTIWSRSGKRNLINEEIEWRSWRRGKF